MESPSSYSKTFEIWTQERDYAKPNIQTRRNLYYTFKCDCGRVLDEIRMQHDTEDGRRKVTLVARKPGRSRQIVDVRPDGSFETQLRPQRRWQVIRGWTRRGRRWACPCGQDWQRDARRILDAMLTAAANRPIGVKEGDRSRVVLLGTDL